MLDGNGISFPEHERLFNNGQEKERLEILELHKNR